MKQSIFKQSIFKKDFTVTGKNGTFTGSVVATLNYRTKIITGTNAITHDDYTKSVPIHKVEGFISGNLWSKDNLLLNEGRVLSVSKDMINAVERELLRLANQDMEPTFIEKMNKLFK